MDAVLDYLTRYKYVAMFTIILLCGVGLPIPEEVTLIGSGILVGLQQADFWISSAVLVAAIIIGDSIPFFLGRAWGQKLLTRMLKAENRALAEQAFLNHRFKTVFFARFVAGLRIPVYAYAGAQRMSWGTFALLDLAGALLSGPTSVWIGKFAAERFGGDLEKAKETAKRLSGEFHNWLLLGVALIVVGFVVFQVHKWVRRRVLASVLDADRPPPPLGSDPTADLTNEPRTPPPTGTSDREAPPGA